MAEFSFLTKLSTWKSICNPLYFRVKQYCDDKKSHFPRKKKVLWVCNNTWFSKWFRVSFSP